MPCELTPDERMECFRNGALLAGYEAKVPLATVVDALTKTAQPAAGALVAGTSDALESTVKGIASLSAITGIPLGIAAHIVGRKINDRSGDERQLELTRDHYTSVAKQLEAGLSQ